MKKVLLLLYLSTVTYAQAQTKEESALIRKTTAFYQWYKAGRHRMDDFELFKGKGKESTPPYHINWPAVERYFTYIRTSVPALGEAFITWHRNDFVKIDKWFKGNPTDEVPAGFDYDRIVGGQVGAAEALEDAFPEEGKWEVKIKGSTATVTWVYRTEEEDTGEMMEVRSITELKKERGTWKISRTIGMTGIDMLNKEGKAANSTAI